MTAYSLLRSPFAPLLLAFAALAGCGIEGDRADGGCPDDEVCSDATPRGLRFFGTSVTGAFFGAFGIAPVAVGGTQDVRADPEGGYSLPIFDAVSSTGAFTVENISGSVVTIAGQTAGASYLRLLDETDGGTLLDRIELESAVVTRAVIAPVSAVALYSAPERRNAVFAPGEHKIAIHLLDADDRIVVDAGMDITVTEGAVDGYDARTITLGAADVPVGVDAAGQHFDIAVELAPAIDGIELIDWTLSMSDDGLPAVARGGSLCVVGLAGEDWVIGQTAEATFALDGAALAVNAEQVSTFCVTIPADAPLGAAVLDVSVGAATDGFDVEITAGASTSALTVEEPGRARVLGERARNLAY
jgi:hypothetical protein